MSFDFKILTDEVVESDLFTDKTHEKSADTLSKVISASDTSITIGLEGAWGAGKSTVINMLNQKLRQDTQQKTLFFLFDAWAHKDDPLRKIFLESLIEKINIENADSKNLEKTHKEIVGKVKTIDITAHKTVSPLGKYLAFSAMIVPLGTVLIRTVKPENLGPLSIDSSINWTYCFGFLLVIAPILVLIYWFFGGEDQDPKIKRPIVGNKKNWDFFTKESTETIKQDVTEQGEKTSIEFQKYFDEIIKIAFEKYNYKQVIIVVDNLDRVDSDQAKSVWSTLQTFFQSRSLSSSTAQSNKIIFIVPYDKEGFSAIWAKSNESKDEVASSFLDKCFQVRVEVPQPISSGWLNYCEQCINQALIGWDAERKIQIKEEYSRILTSNNIIPTPRQIRSWVNQVGMNGYKWKDTVSAEALAIYSYERLLLTEKELLKDLLKSESEFYKLSNGLELVYEISGLLFGVSKERGIEILLHGMIEKCFEDVYERKGELKAIVEQHQKIFWMNWNNIKKSIFIKYSSFELGEINDLTDYISAELGGYDVKNDLNEILNVWQKSTEKDWKLDSDWRYTNTIRNLIDLLGKQEKDIIWLSDFVRKLCIYNINNVDKINTSGVKDLKGLVDLVRAYDKPILKLEHPKLTKENWSKWIKITKDANVLFNEIYPSKKDFNNWTNAIFDNPTQLSSEDFSLLILSLDIVKEKSNWLESSEKLVNLFGKLNYQQRSLNVDKVYEFTYLILRKFDDKNLKDALRTPVFIQAVQQSDLSLTPSIKFLLALVYNTEITTTKDAIRAEIKDYWLSGDEKKMKETVDFFEKASDLDFITYLARDSHNKLAQYILNKKTSDVDFTSNSEDYGYIDEVCKNINDEEFTNRYIKSLCHNSSIDNELSSFQENPIAYAECFNLLMQFGTDAVKEEILRVIKNISIESWRNDLRANKKLIDLFDYDLSLDHKFSEAFADWLDFSMLNKDDNQDKIWRLFHIIEGKILDKQLVYSNLKKKFFENNPIQWSRESTQYVAGFWTDLGDIDPQYIINKLNFWVDAKEWMQIEWVTGLLEDNTLRSELLESRVQTNFVNEENSEEVKLILERLLKKILLEKEEVISSED
ncbi:P-loop NTPase fold protein [Acinetobacter gyllenbergii]|uniref:P-loop NTPase fold protein n=1 Tax=Acinetobacter gyllenbergii TaxID=134534 RepID=UPI003F54D2CB